ncbi:acyl-CoA transferase [Anopheles sinensis]|uniref:Acyl-CoA transferase n=1 Tax=Anopheles sinensis TaxID=74873 RepID=A0A084WBM5_ANOSI|nr:acyl-CoA transferase [Anopheles sinensis]
MQALVRTHSDIPPDMGSQQTDQPLILVARKPVLNGGSGTGAKDLNGDEGETQPNGAFFPAKEVVWSCCGLGEPLGFGFLQHGFSSLPHTDPRSRWTSAQFGKITVEPAECCARDDRQPVWSSSSLSHPVYFTNVRPVRLRRRRVSFVRIRARNGRETERSFLGVGTGRTNNDAVRLASPGASIWSLARERDIDSRRYGHQTPKYYPFEAVRPGHKYLELTRFSTSIRCGRSMYLQQIIVVMPSC